MTIDAYGRDLLYVGRPVTVTGGIAMGPDPKDPADTSTEEPPVEPRDDDVGETGEPEAEGENDG